MTNPNTFPPIENDFEIIRQALMAALDALNVGQSARAFEAQRRLFAAYRALDRLEKEAKNENISPDPI